MSSDVGHCGKGVGWDCWDSHVPVVLCQPSGSQCLSLEQQIRYPGLEGPLKELAVSSLTLGWLFLPPFPASQTLWVEGYVGWPDKQRKEQRPDGKTLRQDGQSMPGQLP